MSASNMDEIITGILAPHFQCSPVDRRPIIVMTCGLAGSGKTTLAKAIQSLYPNFHRLSIDEILYSAHGIYGVDYPASSSVYAHYLTEAASIYASNFHTLLAEKKDVILERSFYEKEDRDRYKRMAEGFGARIILLFLKAEGEKGKEVLWERICKRSAGSKTADSALDISREIFEGYWEGLEDPSGEGEIVIKVI